MGESIWNFVIHTPDHNEYLWSLRNLTRESHTKNLLAEEIERIIEIIGPSKFSAIVTNAGANVQAARRIVTEKYQHIINIRCIAHAVNLISKDICKTQFTDKMLQRSSTLVNYFKSSHQAGKGTFLFVFKLNNALTIYTIGQKLKDLANEGAVEEGGLKRWVETRWHTMYNCANSVLRHRIPLETVSINTSLREAELDRSIFNKYLLF